MHSGASAACVCVCVSVYKFLAHIMYLCLMFYVTCSAYHAVFAAQIDLPLANVERVNEQLHNVFGFSPEEGIQVRDVVCGCCEWDNT